MTYIFISEIVMKKVYEYINSLGYIPEGDIAININGAKVVYRLERAYNLRCNQKPNVGDKCVIAFGVWIISPAPNTYTC